MTTIEGLFETVFSVGPVRSVQLKFGVVQSAVGDSRGKKSTGEDLACDLKTLRVPAVQRSAAWSS
jgi:hypothetical protein